VPLSAVLYCAVLLPETNTPGDNNYYDQYGYGYNDQYGQYGYDQYGYDQYGHRGYNSYSHQGSGVCVDALQYSPSWGGWGFGLGRDLSVEPLACSAVPACLFACPHFVDASFVQHCWCNGALAALSEACSLLGRP
jgi:hypothetical protein